MPKGNFYIDFKRPKKSSCGSVLFPVVWFGLVFKGVILH